MKLNAFLMKNAQSLIIAFIVLVIALVSWVFYAKEKYQRSLPDDVEVVKSWELPKILEEVSGIALMNENRIACVQDENGTVFIYDLSTSTIEKEIHFGENGDYEGIAVVNKNAYVLRSDGTLFEIFNFYTNPGNPTVNMYNTPMTRDHELEGLCYDKSNNRLLLAMKESDHENNAYKGVFEFDFATKKLNTSPVYRLNEKMEITKDRQKFRPSEIAIDPTSGKMYVLTARMPQIIEFENGRPVEFYKLNKYVFSQPEGLTFGPNGEIFISNEGTPGEVFQIRLQKNAP